MRTALAGAGFIAATHGQVLRELGVTRALLIDRNREKADSFAAEYGFEEVSDCFEDIFTRQIDCVHICTPPGLHFEEIRALLNAGIAVFAEKPLCIDAEEARTLMQLAREKRVLCAVDFNVRYHRGVQEVRRHLQKESFGKVRMIHGAYLQEFHAMPCPYGWRYDPVLAGPTRAITEIGSHWMDLLEYITGKRILSVNAMSASPFPYRKVQDGMLLEGTEQEHDLMVTSEDAVTVLFTMEDGIIGSFVLSEISPGRTNALSFEITGDCESISWNAECNNEIQIGRKGAGTSVLRFPFDGGFADTQRAVMAAFYRDLASGEPSGGYPTFEDGYRSARLCHALYESAQHQGEKVFLGEE